MSAVAAVNKGSDDCEVGKRCEWMLWQSSNNVFLNRTWSWSEWRVFFFFISFFFREAFGALNEIKHDRKKKKHKYQVVMLECSML